MKRLVEHLAGRLNDVPVFVSSAESWTAGDVLSVVASARANANFTSRKRYRILARDDLELILGLVALDGWAEEIVLIPDKEVPTSHLESVPEFSMAREGLRSSESSRALSSGQTCDTRWVLTTSGTTGRPKLVPHDLASLTRSTRTDSKRGRDLRWGLLYDPRRFAGLQVVFQALLGGSSLAIASDRSDFGKTIAEFGRLGVNAISATPSLWRKLMLAGLEDQLDLQIVTLGGEIADGAILGALRRRFPQARITHIYASTEAGVGFSVGDCQAGFPASFLENPPQGIELKVDSKGYLFVRPGRKLACYEDGTALMDSEGWICTEDLVEKRGDRFHFLGRAGGAINVGGSKVQPKEIEDVALSVAGVVLAVARAKQNAIVGQVPELLIEAEEGADSTALKREVLNRCRTELPREKWPAVVRVVDRLDLSEAGKVLRAYPGTLSETHELPDNP